MSISNKVNLKKFAYYILTFIIPFMFCYLVLEFGLARFYYSDIHKVSYSIFDPIIGWRLKPGTYWIKASQTFKKHSIYINQYGLRNREITNNAGKGIKKIIILGDSFAFGEMIQEEDLFSTQLEKILNQNFSNKFTNKWEVINAGVPAYGNAQELLFMKKLSENNIIGDIYLLIIFINDILDNLRLSYEDLAEHSLQPGFVLDSNGKIELKHLPQDNTTNYPANFIAVRKPPKLLITAEILKTRIESFLQTKPNLVKSLVNLGLNVKFPRTPVILNGWYQDNILEAGIPLMKEIIKEIKSEADRNNSILLISMIPSPIQIYLDSYRSILKDNFDDSNIDNFLKNVERPQQIVRNICEGIKIPFLDLYPILLQNNNIEIFLPRDGHFNKNGHSIVARSLAQFIMENGY